MHAWSLPKDGGSSQKWVNIINRTIVSSFFPFVKITIIVIIIIINEVPKPSRVGSKQALLCLPTRLVFLLHPLAAKLKIISRPTASFQSLELQTAVALAGFREDLETLPIATSTELL